VLERLDRWLTIVETTLLGAALAAMLGLSMTQIVLRNVFDAGIGWADPLVRVLVLWVGLLGAVTAARRNKHIRVDVLTRFLSPRWRALAGVVGHAVTSFVAALVGWHGARLVLMEREFETIAFSGIPAWTLQTIIPVGFGLIALTYAVGAIVAAIQVFRPPAEAPKVPGE